MPIPNFIQENLHLYPLIHAVILVLLGYAVSLVRMSISEREMNYTRAEKHALDEGRISIDALRRYHGDINWGSYSILLISLFCVLISIVYTDIDKSSESDKRVLMFAAFELGAAGTILVFADLMHMNGNSPVVRREDRFRIVNSGILAGVGSVFLLLAGMQTFSLLISPQIMWGLCAVELVAVCVFVWVRAIRKG